MDFVPMKFCDDAACLVYGSAKRLQEIGGLWGDCAAAQHENYVSLDCTIRPNADFSRFRVILSDSSARRSPLADIWSLNRRFTKISSIYVSYNVTVRKEIPGNLFTDGNQVGAEISFSELRFKFIPLLRGIVRWNKDLHIGITSRAYNPRSIELLDILGKMTSFCSLVITYLGPESEAFVKHLLQSGKLDSLYLKGNWPESIQEQAVTFVRRSFSELLVLSGTLHFKVFEALFEGWSSGATTSGKVWNFDASMADFENYRRELQIKCRDRRVIWRCSENKCALVVNQSGRPVPVVTVEPFS